MPQRSNLQDDESFSCAKTWHFVSTQQLILGLGIWTANYTFINSNFRLLTLLPLASKYCTCSDIKVAVSLKTPFQLELRLDKCSPQLVVHLGATLRNHRDYVNICTKGHVWLLLLPLKCAGFTVCERPRGWCVQDRVSCHCDERVGVLAKVSGEDKKGQWMKYLMESGSPCLDYKAFEV